MLIISDLAEAQKELEEMLGGMFGDASSTVVIEEFLSGIECSVFALTDGKDYVTLWVPLSLACSISRILPAGLGDG